MTKINIKNKNILHLILKKESFDVMVTGEKSLEFMKPCRWIQRRMGKNYDLIKFTNGYGYNRPYFICEFIGWECATENIKVKYSNRFKVSVKKDDVILRCGMIVEHDLSGIAPASNIIINNNGGVSFNLYGVRLPILVSSMAISV